MDVHIDDKLARDLEEHCRRVQKDVDKFVHNAIRRQLAIDKYGDLNERMTKVKTNGEEGKRAEVKNIENTLGNGRVVSTITRDTEATVRTRRSLKVK
ncbi:MAG: hypothetical protein J6Y37_15825 [Paludibacteraceae bacterium]|nr:hypothetical protein [Paludibacteraceae bacterium]